MYLSVLCFIHFACVNLFCLYPCITNSFFRLVSVLAQSLVLYIINLSISLRSALCASPGCHYFAVGANPNPKYVKMTYAQLAAQHIVKGHTALRFSVTLVSACYS